MNSFWNFSVGDLISGVGLLFVVYKIVNNHLWHLKQGLHEAINDVAKRVGAVEARLSTQIEYVEKKLDEHTKWHLDH